MNSKYKKDFSSGVMFFSLGLFAFLISPVVISAKGMGNAGSARIFPQFIGVGLMVLSFLLILETFISYKKSKKEGGPEEEKVKREKGKENVVIIFAAMVLVYILLFDKLGYIITTIGVTTGALFLFRVKKAYYYLIVYGVDILVYFAFTKLLFVQLP